MRNRALLFLAAATAAPAVTAASPTVMVRPSKFGRVLFDGRGFVLYAFTADRAGRSSCTGACANAWPPYTVRKRPTHGGGSLGRPHLKTAAWQALAAAVKRRDGHRCRHADATCRGPLSVHHMTRGGP